MKFAFSGLSAAFLLAAALFSGSAVARAQTPGQSANCPLNTIPKIVSASTYTLSSADKCQWVILTNSGGVTVTLPAPGLIFPPEFSTTFLPTGGGAITFVGKRDQAGALHLVNSSTSLVLAAGSGAQIKALQDMNWWVATLGGNGSGIVPPVADNATLKGLSGGIFPVVYRQGYFLAGDGGAATYIWNAASTCTDDGGSCIQPNTGSGRWLATFDPGGIDPRAFGAKCDGLTDDTATLTAADGATGISRLSVLGTCRVSSNLALAHPVYIGPQGALSIDVAKTLTLSGAVQSDASAPFPGAGTVSLSSTGTSPAGSGGKMTANSQALHGTVAANKPLYANSYEVTSDDAALSGASFPGEGGPFHYAMHIGHHFGGAAMIGGANALGVEAIFDGGATSGSNTNRNYVSIFAHSWAETADGGTGTAFATAKGAFFGMGAIMTATTGATNLINIAAAEFNTDAQAGSSGWVKEGVTIAGQPTDVAAFTHNIGLTLSSTGAGTLGYDSLISFNDYHGKAPQRATGCAICGDSETAGPGALGAIATGIDLSQFNITGDLLKGNGNVRLTGGVLFGTVNTAVLPASANTSWAIQDNLNATGEVNIFNIQNNAGGFTFNQKTGASTQLALLTLPGTGGLQFNNPITAGLPTCNAASKGLHDYVVDATAPTYGGALVGGGTINTGVQCNGAIWTTH